MDDTAILQTIARLIDEEHQLLSRGEEQPLSDAEHHRIKQIEVTLDQC